MTNDPVIRERVQELTWALLDDQITDDELKLLDTLLLSDDQARRINADCVQMHVELTAHFAVAETGTGTKVRSAPLTGVFKDSAMPFGFETTSSPDAAN